MAFVDVDDVIAVNEGYLSELFRTVMNIEIELPIARLTYAEAMRRYGSDKPDLRFGMELTDVSGLVWQEARSRCSETPWCRRHRAPDRRAPAEAAMTRKEIDALGEYVKTYRAKGLAWLALDKNRADRSPSLSRRSSWRP
jgi:aspartyl-tRNA synthetase